MNELMYSFRDKNVRVVMKDNEPWFVAKDVCDILGLENVSRALERLKEKNRGLTTNQGSKVPYNLNIINESGLYQLIFSSRKEEAEYFRDWVFEEVLPSIRKTGSYSNKPKSQLELILEQTKAMIEQERKLNEVESKVDNITEIIGMNSNEWRDTSNKILKSIAYNSGGKISHNTICNESYERLERRGGFNLNKRLENLKQRKLEYGVSQSKVNATNKLDVIGTEKRMVEIYLNIIKEMAIQNNVNITKYNLEVK